MNSPIPMAKTNPHQISKIAIAIYFMNFIFPKWQHGDPLGSVVRSYDSAREKKADVPAKSTLFQPWKVWCTVSRLCWPEGTFLILVQPNWIDVTLLSNVIQLGLKPSHLQFFYGVFPPMNDVFIVRGTGWLFATDWLRLLSQKRKSKIIHRSFLVVAMFCQASSMNH